MSLTEEELRAAEERARQALANLAWLDEEGDK